MNTSIEFTRINNDVNGNPRYVCHFLNFISEFESRLSEEIAKTPLGSHGNKTEVLYKVALHKAKQIGGKKFHNKQYGGGIVFQSYNIQETERRIKELVNN